MCWKLPERGALWVRLLSLAILPLGSATLLFLWNNFEEREAGRARAGESAQALVDLSAAYEEGVLEHARQLLAAMAQLPQVRGTDRPGCHTFLRSALGLFPDYLNFGIIERDGTVFAAAQGGIPANLADRSYFQRALQTKQFAVGDYQVGRLTGRPSLNVGFFLRRTDGAERVMYAALDLASVSHVVQHFRLPTDAVLGLFDQQGQVLARMPDSSSNFPVSIRADEMRAAADGRSVLTRETASGDRMLFCASPVRTQGETWLYAGLAVPAQQAFAHANLILTRNLLLLGGIALLSLCWARAYAQRSILLPVQSLVRTAQEIAGGDWQARTGLRHNAGELGRLARAFDEMAGRIEQAHSEVRRLNATLEQRIGERTAQLQQANHELEAFSYSVSHDLRAPLRHVHGFSQLLLKHAGAALDSKGLRYMSLIGESIQKMGLLIDELLAFSRMARCALQQTAVDSEAIVRQVISDLQSSATHPVQWQIDSLPSVRADPAMLRIVWTNLLSNAVKYSRTVPEPRIHVGTREGAHGQTVFFVRDNGVGFDMAYVDKLFGVFQRLHQESDFEGTGIGLATVRRIVTRHGGQTWAEGKVSQGATFSFSMPSNDPTPSP